MQPADQTLLRLADPNARATLLDSAALLAIAQVCYAIDPATVVGPTTAVYNAMDIAVAVTPQVEAYARWSRATDPVPVEASASLAGLVPAIPGADAVWSGSVVVRTAGGNGTITDATAVQPDLDAAILAAVAALPGNATPADVVAAQRQAVEEALAAPAATLTDTELDGILKGVLAGGPDQSIPELGLQSGGRRNLGVQVTFSAIPPVTQSTPPVLLPMVVAFLVADANASPRALLEQSEVARRAAAAYSTSPPPKDAPPQTRPRCVCWLIDATAFDDDGWPGAGGGNAQQQQTARLAAARAWLTGQGIAVVTT